MKSPLKLLVAAGPVVSLGLCLAMLLLWLRSFEAYPAVALASGGRTWHAGARRGEVWLTCATGWPAVEDARRAARTARAARPLVVASRRFDQFDQANRDLVAHAGFLRQRLGAGDPEAAAEERLAGALWPRMREELVRQAGGPPAEPVIAERPPEVHARWGFASERAWARFPLRGDDGGIGYGPRVALAAVALPCWVPAAVFAAWPVGIATGEILCRLKARGRRRSGRCGVCGYDLRATGDVGGPRLDRCPECGTPAAATAVVVLLLLLTGSPARAADPTTSPVALPDDPAARELVLANERSRERLPAFTAVVTVTNPYVQDEPFDLVYRAKGNARYMYGLAETGRLGGGRTRVVLNDAYLAVWQEGEREGYQVEMEAGARIPANGPGDGGYYAAGLLRCDPLNYAYGYAYSVGDYPLRRALAAHGAIRCSVGEGTDAAGRRVEQLKVYAKRPPGPNLPEWVYDLDPERGHAITRVAAYSDGGEPRAQLLIDLQPAGDGWVPSRIREVIRNDEPAGAGKLRRNLDVRLTSVGDVPDAAFRMGALDLPERVYMVRTTTSGTKQPLVLHDRLWVPVSPAWFPVRSATTVPVQRPLAKGAWPAAVVAAGAVWVFGIVLMRRRFGAR